MLLAQCLKRKYEGVGFGARNKIAHNRSETAGKQGVGGPGGVGGVLIAQGCLESKDFEGCNAEWRRAGNWPCLALPYHASGPGLQPSV